MNVGGLVTNRTENLIDIYVQEMYITQVREHN